MGEGRGRREGKDEVRMGWERGSVGGIGTSLITIP